MSWLREDYAEEKRLWRDTDMTRWLPYLVGEGLHRGLLLDYDYIQHRGCGVTLRNRGNICVSRIEFENDIYPAVSYPVIDDTPLNIHSQNTYKLSRTRLFIPRQGVLHAGGCSYLWTFEEWPLLKANFGSHFRETEQKQSTQAIQLSILAKLKLQMLRAS